MDVARALQKVAIRRSSEDSSPAVPESAERSPHRANTAASLHSHPGIGWANPAPKSSEYLVDTEVALDPPIAVSPGLSSIVRWSFVVTPEMATRVGRYRLSFTFDELGESARASFSVGR